MQLRSWRRLRALLRGCLKTWFLPALQRLRLVRSFCVPNFRDVVFSLLRVAEIHALIRRWPYHVDGLSPSGRIPTIVSRAICNRHSIRRTGGSTLGATQQP